MSTGHGGGFPDYSGGEGGDSDGYGHEGYGHEYDPYAVGPGGTDPYASEPYPAGPEGADPYASAPYVSEPHPAGPYPAGPYPAGPHPAGPPQYGAYPPPLPSSNAALAGFVLGLAGLVMCAGLPSPFGIWFSAVGMKETGPEASVPKGGRGFAVAGLVTSLIGLIPLLFVLLYFALIIIGFVSAAIS